MKMYRVKPNNKGVTTIVVKSGNEDTVAVELWRPKKITHFTFGVMRYNVETLTFKDRVGYTSMLFNHRDGTTARQYIKKLGYKIQKAVI